MVMKQRFFIALASCFALAVLNFSPSYANTSLTPQHGIAMWDDLKYPAHFQHFDYVNPNAPKGGTLKQAGFGTFDNVNPFVLKGVAADSLGLVYDTLLVKSKDEPFSLYGLIAESLETPKDRSWVIFNLRKEARWRDGSPITADDVEFTFNILMQEGHPRYRTYYRDVAGVEVLGPHRVKFTFKQGASRELPLIIGELNILSKSYYAEHEFAKSTLTPPMTSGPYYIEKLEGGRYITFKRDPDYWGKDLPVNVGRYNFDIFHFDYYRDANVAVEALKAGEYDVRLENISKTWATAYDIPSVKEGRLIKTLLPDKNPDGMQGFVLNTRRSKFQDRKVREALQYTYDFEWVNKQIFYDAYTRTGSYFSNSEFASSGLPSKEELAILEPYRDQLPPELFTSAYQNPTTDGSGNNRAQLIKARDLLKEAGWVVKDNQLVHKDTGELFEIEFLVWMPSFKRVIAPMIKSLAKLGIKAHMRVVDSAQFIKRQEEFDFDITTKVFGQSLSPGNEQLNYWHSSYVDVIGSQNAAGVNHPVVDALVEKLINAQNKQDLIHTTRALDRVLLWNFYVVPHWHTNYYRLLYWNKFGLPETMPTYDVGLDSWWYKGMDENQ